MLEGSFEESYEAMLGFATNNKDDFDFDDSTDAMDNQLNPDGVQLNTMLSRELIGVVDPLAMQIDDVKGFGNVSDRLVFCKGGIRVDFTGTDLETHCLDTFVENLADHGDLHQRLLGPNASACLLHAAKTRVVQELSPTSTLQALAKVVSRHNALVMLLSRMVGAPSLSRVLVHESTLVALCTTVGGFESNAELDSATCATAMNALRFVDDGIFLTSKGVGATQTCVQIAKIWNTVLQRALFISSDRSLIRDTAGSLVQSASFIFLTANSACESQTFAAADSEFPGHLEALLHPECVAHHSGAARVLCTLNDDASIHSAGEFPLVLRNLLTSEAKYHSPGAPLSPEQHLHLLAPQILCHATQLVFSDRAAALKVIGMLFDHTSCDELDAGERSLGVILRKMYCASECTTWSEVMTKSLDHESTDGLDARVDMHTFLLSQLGTEIARIALHLSQHVAAHEANASNETVIRFCVEMNDFVWGRLVTASAKQASRVPMSSTDHVTISTAACASNGIVAIWNAGRAHQNGTPQFLREERATFLRPIDKASLEEFAKLLPAAPSASSAMAAGMLLGSHLTGVNPDSITRAFEYFVKAPAVLGSRSARQTRQNALQTVMPASPRQAQTLAVAKPSIDQLVSARDELSACMERTDEITTGRKRAAPPKALTSGTAKAHVYLDKMELEILDAHAILEFGKRCIEGGTQEGKESMAVIAFRKFEGEIDFRQSASAKKEGGFKAKTQLDQAFSVVNLARWRRCTGSIGEAFGAADLFPGTTQAYMSSVEFPEVCTKIAERWDISPNSVRSEHIRGNCEHAFGTFHVIPDKQTHLPHGWSVVQAIRRKMRAHSLYSYHKNIVACLMDSGWEESLALAVCMREPGGSPYNSKGCSGTHFERYYKISGALSFQDCVLSTGTSSTFPNKSPSLPQPGRVGDCGAPLGAEKRRKVSNDPADTDTDTDDQPAKRTVKITGDTRPCKNGAPNGIDQLLFMREVHTMVVPIAIDSLGGIVVLAGIVCLSSEHAFHTLSGLLPVFMACDLHRVDVAAAELTRLSRCAFETVASHIQQGHAHLKTTFRANPTSGATETHVSATTIEVEAANFNNPIGYSYLLASIAGMFDPSAVKVTENDIADKAARARTSRVNPFQAVVNTFTNMACSTTMDIEPEDLHIDESFLSPSMRGRYQHHFGENGVVSCASLVPHVRDFMGCVDGSRLADGEYLFAAQTAFAIYRVVVLKQTDFTMPKNFGAFTSTLQHRQSVRGIVADMIASEQRSRATHSGHIVN